MANQLTKLENFLSICRALYLPKEEIDKLATDSDTVDIIFEAFENAVRRSGWKREDQRVPPFFDKTFAEEVHKSFKSCNNSEAYKRVKESLEKCPNAQGTFGVICQMMYLEKDQIDELQTNPVIVEMVFEGFGNAAQRVEWKSECIDHPTFTNLLLEEVIKCVEVSTNTNACRQFAGIIADMVACQPKLTDVEEQKILDKGFEELNELRNKNDPFIHFENQRIRKSRFCQMDHEPCLLVKIPNSNEFVAADKAKMVPWLRAEGFDVKRLHNGDKDPLITFDLFADKPFTGGVEEFKAALETIMKSGEKGDKKKKEEESKERLDADAQRLAEKKKERNRKTKENKKNKMMMAKEGSQDTPTSSETPGSSESKISELVKKLMDFEI